MSRKPGGATLSNGTLSLRFMQRGGTQHVAATAAKVVDEAEWDIGPLARAAWGVSSHEKSGGMAQQPQIHVIRDESYLPFVFDQETPTLTTQRSSGSEAEPEPAARRRVFREGAEVAYEDPSLQQNSTKEEDQKGKAATDSDIKATGSSSSAKTPSKSISGPKATTGPQQAHKSGARRHRLEGFIKPTGLPGTGFMKPAGVSTASSHNGTKRSREDDSSRQDRTGSKIKKTS